MPLGITRLNVRTAQPNPNINFIKPMEGPDQDLRRDFLERVAAIAVPIMKKNHIYVMSLEDFPPNNEFLGRNFNAGEAIQLVLKNKSGGFLPIQFVQRVLMHELAHCKQMNHSKAFWQVNNQHCVELKVLWDKGYTGEGMWSKGVLLANGNFVQNRPLAEGDVPEHLCGGTFRSNRKRKRGAAEKEKISYQERQQRRIAKKFGTNGVTLGADDEVKAKLENGKRPAGKPRVAGSARGRELRAAAALARFEKPQVPLADGFGNSEVSDTESDEGDTKIKPDDAKDLNGKRLVDSNGRGMIKVCEDGGDDADADKEMEELRNLEYVYGKQSEPRTKTLTSHLAEGTGQETFKNSYKSPYSSSGTGYHNNSTSVSKTEKEHNTKKEILRKTSSQHPIDNLDPSKTKTVKQEVFDMLSEYLGDPTCNPGGAIYSGLDAARASMLKRKSQDSTNSFDHSVRTTSGFGANGISNDGMRGIRASQPQMENNAKFPTMSTYSSSGLPSEASVSLPPVRSLPHSNHHAVAPPLSSHLSNNYRSPNDSHLAENYPATYDEFRSSAVRNPLSSSAGAASKFARAVEKHHRAETIGLPPSPEPIPKLPSSLADTQRSRKTNSMHVPTSQQPNALKQPPPPSRSAPSRPPLENVTNFPSTPSARPVPQHQPPPTAQTRPNASKPSTQAPRPAPQLAPVSRAPAPAPRPMPEAPVPSTSGTCKVCTTINEAESLTCMICSNVLHPQRDPFHWRCKSAACKGTEYVNSGDYGVCGVCGEKKQL